MYPFVISYCASGWLPLCHSFVGIWSVCFLVSFSCQPLVISMPKGQQCHYGLMKILHLCLSHGLFADLLFPYKCFPANSSKTSCRWGERRVWYQSSIGWLFLMEKDLRQSPPLLRLSSPLWFWILATGLSRRLSSVPCSTHFSIACQWKQRILWPGKTCRAPESVCGRWMVAMEGKEWAQDGAGFQGNKGQDNGHSKICVLWHDSTRILAGTKAGVPGEPGTLSEVKCQASE